MAARGVSVAALAGADGAAQPWSNSADDERVAGTACCEGLMQPRPIAVGTGQTMIDEMRSADTPKCRQTLALHSQVLWSVETRA